MYDNAQELYYNDPGFRGLVDFLELRIEALHLSPGEVRDAAMLAAIRFEQRHARPFVMDEGIKTGGVKE